MRPDSFVPALRERIDRHVLDDLGLRARVISKRRPVHPHPEKPPADERRKAAKLLNSLVDYFRGPIRRPDLELREGCTDELLAKAPERQSRNAALAPLPGAPLCHLVEGLGDVGVEVVLLGQLLLLFRRRSVRHMVDVLAVAIGLLGGLSRFGVLVHD